ncbi:hypothetical protein XENOCAPTIV_023524 [Xenoophorus captivus]|uniref:Uncharacterized protein n=1 Tax=Xenoophorus captivus TaxID=1517983 RepID=A0ABV0QNZ5_9TELE
MLSTLKCYVDSSMKKQELAANVLKGNARISKLHSKFAEKSWNHTFQLVRRCMVKQIMVNANRLFFNYKIIFRVLSSQFGMGSLRIHHAMNQQLVCGDALPLDHP